MNFHIIVGTRLIASLPNIIFYNFQKMNLKTLQDIGDLNGKKVFLRVDFNVPLDENGEVQDTKRIELALPTIKYLLEHNVSQIIITTHLGRPKNNEPELMTDKVAEKLGELLGEAVSKGR